jgi:ubiquinone/menaquinone biosynthesis C-methylase UbiE
MSVSYKEFLELREYIRASRELTSWITGAKVFALLNGAVDSGVMDALQTKRTAHQVAEITKIDNQIIVDMCLALKVHGIVQQVGEYYELTPDFALLSSPNAAIPLSNLIHYSGVMLRTLQTVSPTDVTYTTTSAEDILTMAEGSGISALSSSPHVGQDSIAQVMPEVETIWQEGAHHLEVGCGIGNSLFGTVTTYPNVTAVGIEINELTAAEAERRAYVLGVTDRVEVRRMDACELQDEGTFDTIQWSQFFFPTATRPIVLKAMHRALKPDGYLFMPWMGSVSNGLQPSRLQKLRIALRALRSGSASYLGYINDIMGDTPKRRNKERRSAALNILLFTRWGVPVYTVEELESEIKSYGFKVIRSIHTPVSQFALTRGFLLAQREMA